MGDVPSDPNHPIAEADKNLVMNVQLPHFGWAPADGNRRARIDGLQPDRRQ
jgi:hypothetical protein